MIYTTGTTATLMKVSRETIRTWAEEFAPYLSSAANPGDGKHRQFTDEDLAVLSLVARFKSLGRTYDDAHDALRSGERDTLDTSAITGASNSREIVLLEAQISSLRQQLTDATRERDTALTAAAVDRALREQTQERAESLEAEVRKLMREIGRLEARIDDD